MPRGIRKYGEFSFTIWYDDGARVEWRSTRSQSNTEIADAIRRYLVPVMERLAAATPTDAADRPPRDLV